MNYHIVGFFCEAQFLRSTNFFAQQYYLRLLYIQAHSFIVQRLSFLHSKTPEVEPLSYLYMITPSQGCIYVYDDRVLLQNIN